MVQHTIIWIISVLGACGAFYLVFTHRFNDGVLGRCLLATICVSSAAGIFKLLEGGFPTRSVSVTAVCLILLLGRQFYIANFHAAVMRYIHGDHHV